MERQVLLDKLSEFLMVEQGGLQLYRVAASRCSDPTIRQRYEEFGQQTALHRDVLVRLITRLGGDPNYVSPLARLAQVKATKLLEAALIVDGLAPQEIMVNDLENVLLAETKCHADWSLLSQLGKQLSEPSVLQTVTETVQSLVGHPSEQMDPSQVQQALEEAVAEVEAQEDQHVEWARQTLAEISLQMALKGPAPSPMRWQQVVSGPIPPIAEVNPSPMTEGLLPPASQPAWDANLVARMMQTG